MPRSSVSSTAHIGPASSLATAGPARPWPGHRAAKRVEAAGFSVFGALLRSVGRDITREAESRSALILAPHPDDETLGCGATIMRKVEAGRAVRVVIVTDGRFSHRSPAISPNALAAIRREEAVRACGVMGVPERDVIFLEYHDGALKENAREARRRLLRIVREFDPGEVYSPSGIDRHPDHRTLQRIVAGLAHFGGIRCPVLEYPVWFYAAKSWLPYGRPAGALDLLWLPFRLACAAGGLSPRLVSTAGYLERKATALARHATQSRGLPGEPGSPMLDARFVAHFFRDHELFFPLARAPRRGQRPVPPSPLRPPDA
jgi:LmbE family N-acetylglucosaminyl deacetylase